VKTDPGELLRAIEHPFLAAMLYGSVARGDDREGSDIDVLALTRRPFPPRQQGRLSITSYTPVQLVSLARAGSLFVLHLRMEGRILHDPEAALARVLDTYRPPASYAPLHDALRKASAILDTTDEAFARNPEGYCRVALFLLRTEVYARCAERGTPAFAMDMAARRIEDPTIAAAFSGRAARMSDHGFFREVRALVSRYLDTPIHNPHGTLEALAVSTSERAPLASVLAMRVLSGKVEIEYGLFMSEGLLA
jgi:predicted nucleotidyltransferase